MLSNQGVRDLSGWKRGAPTKLYDKKVLKEQIKSIRDERTRALNATLYLTGSRISEVVGGKSRHTDKKDGVLKVRRLPGFRPDQVRRIEFDGKKFFIIEALPVAKKRKKVLYRQVLVLPEDEDLLKIVLDYARGKLASKALFPFTREYAWMLQQKALPDVPLWNHYFRHFHVSHRLSEDGYDVAQTGNEMLWTNMSHLMTYDQRNLTNILKMVVARKRKA